MGEQTKEALKNKVEEIKEKKESGEKLKLSEKIAYGFGDLGNGFMFDLGQMYLSKYFTDICNLPAAVAGSVFAVTKIFDAFMDPFAATIIDNRKKVGKAGRFRPVMLIGAAFLAVMTVVIFSMPNIAVAYKIVFAYATYMLWGVFYSFTNIPYSTLSNVMTRDTGERSQLASFRQGGSLSAQFIAGIVFMPIVLFFDQQTGSQAFGYQIAAVVMAAFGFLAFFICYKGTSEKVMVERASNAKVGIKESFKIIFTNRPLLAMILMTLFTVSAMNTNNMMMTYFCQYNMGDVNLTSRFNGVMIGAAIIAILFVPTLVKRFGKKKVFIGGLVVAVIADFLNYIIPEAQWSFIILVTIGYAALAIPNAVTWAFVADTIDYGEWNSGIRRAGTTTAVFNFSRKLAQALAGVISTGILSATGYVAGAEQSAATLQGIHIAMTLYPAVVLALAILTIFFIYNLSDKKYEQISEDLANGRWKNGKLED